MIKATGKLGVWTGAWLISQALAAFGPKFIWSENTVITIFAILLTLITGLMMVRTNVLYLKALDELEQRIQLEAMGLTLGLTLVVGLSYSLMDTTNLIPVDAEISVLVIFMGLCYLANIVIGKLRYS